MSVFFEFAVLGVVAGALTSLLAVSMVVAYRGSRVVNFAQGAVAMVGTYVFFTLHVTYGIPYAVSFIAGVATSGLISVGMHYLLLNRLKNAPQITKIIGTLGVLELLNEAMSHIEPPYTQFVPSNLPTNSISVLGARVPAGQLIILGLVVAISIVVGCCYRYTQLGRATVAGLDNPRALSALGFSPSAIAGVNWAISGCIAGVAGILLAPIAGLGVATYSLLILPALAAAVFGRFTSLTLAVVGGLVLGIIQSEMGFYIKTPGLADAVPFLLIIVILVFRGIGKVARSAPAQRLPSVGSGVIKWRLVAPALIIALVLTQVVHDPLWLSAIVITAGSAIVLLSFVIITGYSGQLALSQFAFAGLGAWFAGKLIQSAHMPLIPAVLIALVAVIPIGILLALICLRTSGVNLAIATLGFAAGVEYLIFDNSQLSGAEGIQIGTLKVFGLDISAIDQPSRYAAIAVIAVAIAALATANIRRGIAGRHLLALRGNERAAASLGVDVTKAKVFAFAAGSVIAALGGIIRGLANSTIVFSTFSTLPSIEAVAQAIVGGVGWIGGAGIGAVAQPGGLLSQALTSWAGPTYASYVPLFAAVLLLFVIVGQPDGAAPIILKQVKWLLRKIGLTKLTSRLKSAKPKPVRTAGERTASGNIRVEQVGLRVSGLSVSFGGSVALEEVSFDVNPGEIVGLIGPNGAGKSTAIDAVTGYVGYRGGEVSIGGRSLNGLRPSKRAQAGVRRSFQSLELFDDLSVLDNLAIPTGSGGAANYLTSIVRPRRQVISDAAWAAIDAFRLTDVLEKTPGELAYGTRRLVAIARALAGGPSILLLDEPAAGLDDTERRELSEVLVRVAKEWGVGVLLVEHDVPMVMRVCDRIYALDLGRVIASGPSAEVRDDPLVIHAFLGSEVEEELV